MFSFEHVTSADFSLHLQVLLLWKNIALGQRATQTRPIQNRSQNYDFNCMISNGRNLLLAGMATPMLYMTVRDLSAMYITPYPFKSTRGNYVETISFGNTGRIDVIVAVVKTGFVG